MERFFYFVCDGIIFGAIFIICYLFPVLFTNPNDSPWNRYPDNSTCLHQPSSVEQAASLIRRGSDVNARSDSGRTPLHHILLFCGERFDLEQLQITQLLILNGANVNFQDENGKTPLHILFEGEFYEGQRSRGNDRPVSQELLLTLLRAGADIHLKDKQGKTPLDFAPNDATREYMLRWESAPYAEEFKKMLSL